MKLTAMPKFYPTALIQDCWSSIGDITFNLTQKGQSPLCAHIRYRLIDELTGYRNNWQRLPH